MSSNEQEIANIKMLFTIIVEYIRSKGFTVVIDPLTEYSEMMRLRISKKIDGNTACVDWEISAIDLVYGKGFWFHHADRLIEKLEAFIAEGHKAIMITNDELRDKARDAIFHYNAVFGVFPEKAGIEFNRLKSLQIQSLNFPQLQPISRFEDNDSMPSTSIIRVPFVGVVGEKISPDGVYFPHPKKEGKMLNANALLRLLQQRMRGHHEQ